MTCLKSRPLSFVPAAVLAALLCAGCGVVSGVADVTTSAIGAAADVATTVVDTTADVVTAPFDKD